MDAFGRTDMQFSLDFLLYVQDVQHVQRYISHIQMAGIDFYEAGGAR